MSLINTNNNPDVAAYIVVTYAFGTVQPNVPMSIQVREAMLLESLEKGLDSSIHCDLDYMDYLHNMFEREGIDTSNW